MASITHSIGSLASSFENLLAGVAESILAVLRHAFNIVAGILRTSLNVSEEVLEDAWKVIEGIVGAVFSNIFPLILLTFGALAGVIFAQSQAKNSRGGVGASAKGKKKRA